MAHYWESYSNGGSHLTDRDILPDRTWTERVIMHLRGEPVKNPTPSTHNSRVTGPTYIKPSRTSVGIDPELFNLNDDNTKVFIMTPLSSDNNLAAKGVLEYPKKMAELEKQIRRHISLRSLRAVIWGYLRLNYALPEEKEMENQSQRGMALFQYDPKGAPDGTPAWRLYYEGVCYHSSNPDNQC